MCVYIVLIESEAPVEWRARGETESQQLLLFTRVANAYIQNYWYTGGASLEKKATTPHSKGDFFVVKNIISIVQCSCFTNRKNMRMWAGRSLRRARFIALSHFSYLRRSETRRSANVSFVRSFILSRVVSDNKKNQISGCLFRTPLHIIIISLPFRILIHHDISARRVN